jgi:carboxyl-terminal processing protease
MPRISRFMLGTATGVALSVLAFNSGLFPPGSSAIAQQSSANQAYRQLDLFGRVFDIVRNKYVEKPEDQKLVSSALNGMLAGLDPHSSYMDAKAYRDMESDTRGEFGGLGMQVSMEDGAIKVIAPIDDTPAARAGILAGDIISKVDGESIKGMALSQVIEKLRGPAGTTIRLEIARKDQAVPVTLTREVIKVPTIKYRAEGDDVGYIRISQFNRLANDDMKKAIKAMANQLPHDRLKGYILDLRNNPGGLLDQAVAVSDSFLQNGEIVSTRGRYADETQRFDATPGDVTDGKPLIVLINGGSASASEIVAGALQDHKRATVLGTQSFGKGSVQTIIPLGSGNGALRLTTARYFTPSGHSIQAKGITPDIEVLQDVPKNLQSNGESASEAGLRGHLQAEAGEKKGSQAYVPTEPKDDKALQMALGLLRGTEVNAAFPPNQKQTSVR